MVVDSRTPGLSPDERERLDSVELGLTQEQLRRGAAALRLLLDAFRQCANEEAELLIDGLEITDDPYTSGGDEYFLNVSAPMPHGTYGRDEWTIEISRWISDDPEDAGSAIGEPVLSCVQSTPPAVSEIVELLNSSGGRPEKLAAAAWAGTAVGEALEGTTFVVTRRYDS